MFFMFITSRKWYINNKGGITTNDKISLIKSQIESLRRKLNQAYGEKILSYEEILKISQHLDILITEYQKLQLTSKEVTQQQFSN
ncbi:MAG: aspartyl-phosphate phosphatase Spo0E family protein [Clostridia bacterium]